MEVGSIRKRGDDRLNLYLSINPLTSFLDINWFNLSVVDGVRNAVLITNSSVPHISSSENRGVEILYELNLNSTEGTHQTNIKFNFKGKGQIDLEKGCYGFWYHLQVENKIEYSSCISTRANWMYEMKALIGN